MTDEKRAALVLVATPIGNLGDLSPRAIEALTAADVIACEDTRRTRPLLTHAGITGKRLIAVHEHNEAAQADAIAAMVETGQRVALVTDAGMPVISDPGEIVVAAVLAAGLAVEVVPGPSAALTALVLSGLPSRRYAFEGFLPRKGSARTERLAAVAVDQRTTVLYEAPGRVAATLVDLTRVCGGDRRVAIARELTKLHEEVWRGTLAEAVARQPAAETRGEFVLVVEGASPRPPATEDDIARELSRVLSSGADKKTAIAEVAALLGVAKRRVYERAVVASRS